LFGRVSDLIEIEGAFFLAYQTPLPVIGIGLGDFNFRLVAFADGIFTDIVERLLILRLIHRLLRVGKIRIRDSSD